MAVAKSGFTLEDRARMGPSALERKRLLAEALLKQSSGIQDIRHPMQGFAQLAQALVGNLKEGQADRVEMAGKNSAAAQWNELAAGMGMGGEFPQAPGGGGQTTPQQPVGEGGAAIRQGLIERGMPEHVADAFVMNFQDESGLNPGINEAAPIVPGSRGGYGLAQWTGPRRKALESFAAQKGANVADPNVQLDFLMTELQGPESAAAQAIMSAPDAGQAAAAIVNKFLRPAESHRASRERRYLGGQQPVQVAGGGQEAIAQALMQGENNPGNIGMPAPGGGMQAAGGDFPPAPQPQQPWTPAQPIPQGGPDARMLMQAAGNEWMNDSQRGIIEGLLGQQLTANDPDKMLDRRIKEAQLGKLTKGDPMEQLQMQKLQLEIEEKQRGGNADYKVVNDRLIRTGPEGVQDVTPPLPEGGNAFGAENFDDVSVLRKEVQSLPSYKNYSQAVPIYKSMVETAGRDSKASDLNLVYGLGKIMDPTSVVREGEMVMVSNTSSLPDWLNGAINSVNGGAKLTPETREAILTEAYGRMKSYDDQFKQDTTQYQDIIGRNKINPADVIPQFGEITPWKRKKEPVVIEGYTIEEVD